MSLSQFGSEREANEACQRMMVTVACGTARKLGYTWKCDPDGSIEVTMGEHVFVAESWSEFARWMREDWAEKRKTESLRDSAAKEREVGS